MLSHRGLGRASKDEDKYDAAILRGAQLRAPQDDAGSVECLSLGAGVEERRQPGMEMFGDFLGGAVLGVADGAGAGKTLIAAWNIVGDPREGSAAHHRLVGGDFDQGEIRI